MAETLRVCRACLMGAQSREEYFSKLEKYIANLEEDVRASQEVYEARLRLCGQCEKLLEGMCRSCGCFVELRAAVKAQRCPDVNKKW